MLKGGQEALFEGHGSTRKEGLRMCDEQECDEQYNKIIYLACV